MRRYILKRLLQLIPVLLGVTFLSFAMMRLAGSDAITELYGDKGAVSQEIIDAKRAEAVAARAGRVARRAAASRAAGVSRALWEADAEPCG